MAWTTPRTWATNEQITQSLLNTHLRDNLLYLYNAFTNIAEGLVVLQEQYSSGTDGGTFTSGAWRTRLLNTEVLDADSVASLASNQVTFDDGDYFMIGVASAFDVASHQARLFDVVNTATLLTGLTAYAGSSGVAGSLAFVAGPVAIANGAVVELQHQCSTTQASTGFGVAGSFNTEVFSALYAWKVG